MNSQIWLEIKKHSWKMWTVLTLLLFIIFGSSLLSQELKTNKLGISYKTDAGMSKFTYDGGKTNSEFKFILFDLMNTVRRDKEELKSSTDNRMKVKYVGDRRLLATFKKRQYNEFNKQTLALLRNPATSRMISSTSSLLSTSLTMHTEESIARVKYLVNHQISRLIQLDSRSSVVGNLAASFALEVGAGKLAERVNQVLFICGILTFILVFFYDCRHGTVNQMRTVPLSQGKQAVIKAGVELALLNVMIVAMFAVVIGVMALVPGHEFGVWNYPIGVTLMNHVHAIPLCGALLLYLLLINLWFVIFAGAAFCLSLVTRNEIVAAMLMLAGVFASQLNLLAILPDSLAKMLPGAYVNLESIVTSHNEFSSTASIQVVLILAGWGLILWGGGLLLLKLRECVTWRIFITN